MLALKHHSDNLRKVKRVSDRQDCQSLAMTIERELTTTLNDHIVRLDRAFLLAGLGSGG